MMKKLILFVLSAVFLVACTGIDKKDGSDVGTMVMGKTYHLEETVDESVVDITFGEDELSGSAGVNRYFAPYMIEGNEIDVKLVGATRMMGPENLMKQEMEFTKTLEEASEIKFVEDKLVIVSAGGKEMTFIKKIKTLLEEKITGKTFVYEDSLSNYEITIKFYEKKIRGTSGVNKYLAVYVLEGNKLTISPQIITTMMAGPEDAINKESEYLTDLSKAEKIEYIDGKLIITIKDGKQLIFK